MTPQAERWHASWVLRLLLDTTARAAATSAVDWVVLLDIARTNGVLARTAERLATLGVRVPDFFADAVARERERIRCTLELIRHVSRVCDAGGIEFLFPKAFHDYPDMGDDVDLLLLERSARVDRRIVAGLQTSVVRRDVGGWIAGTATYAISSCPSPLDVQHGRLGVVGEHHAFPLVLMRHRRRVVVEGAAFFAPPPEDQLVLQGLQRVWGRLRIALCDVVFTISAIRRGALDWDYIVVTARQHGAWDGLCCYLSYVDQIHRDVFGQPLLSDVVRPALVLEGWGRVAFRRGGYRFPIVRVNSRLYLQQFRTRIAARDWEGAGRLCLIPIVAVARIFHRLARSRTQGAETPRSSRPPANHVAELSVTNDA